VTGVLITEQVAYPAGTCLQPGRRGAHWRGAYCCPGPARICPSRRGRTARWGRGGPGQRASRGRKGDCGCAGLGSYSVGVGRRSVTLVAGTRSRVKILDVQGADPRTLERLLAQ
jgi:hypothetical protein